MQPDTKSVPYPMPEPLVPIETVARHLTVSVSTVRAWLRQGYIPKDAYLKLGNTYRFQLSEVVSALRKNDEKADPVEPVPMVQLVLDLTNPDTDV